MALLRILFLSLFFISLQLHAGEGVAPGAEATEPLEPDLVTIRAEAQKIEGYAATLQISAAQVTSTTTNLKTTGGTCQIKKNAADWVCLEKANPEIVGFVSEYGDLINMGLMVGSSIGEQCKGISNAMSKASTVLGLFQAACKVAQSLCNSSCAKVMPDVTAVQSALTAIQAMANEKVMECLAETVGVGSAACTPYQTASTNIQASAATINSKLPQVKTYTAKKEVVCNKYQVTTQTAMLGALTALKGYAQSKQCEKENGNTTIANQDCNTTTAPGYSSPSCQCARGEKSAAECQNINISAASIKPGSIAIPNTGTTTADKNGLGTPNLGGDSSGIGAIAASAAGAPAPVEGGGGGGMGGGGGSGGLGQDGAGSAKRLNTNVLGGGFGGGGGGGGSSGPGYGMDSNLKNYMPGGKNDPNRSIASQLAKEVTPQAGRSNWEKVRLRYRDNYSSLLNK